MMPIKPNRLLTCLFITIFLLSILLTGCGGLPSDIKKACKKASQKIEAEKAFVDKNQKSYTEYIKTKNFDKIKNAFEKENLSAYFSEAHKDFARAASLYTTNLKPLLKENKEELAPNVMAELKRINSIIIDAENKSKYPIKRVKHIYDIFLKIDNIYHESAIQVDNITKTVNDLEANILVQARSDFPDKTEKIDAKFNQLYLMEKQSKSAVKIISVEYNNHKKNRKTDYSALTKNADLLEDNFRQTQILKNNFTKDIASLSKSYTKILKDMKPIYSVVVKRESWNNSQDYYNPVSATFARTVSQEVYEFIETNQIETIAQLYPNWNNLKMKNHIGNVWEKLKIDPVENWPQQYRHDSASFWFDNWSTQYFHKYTIVEEGEKHETDWQPVSEDTYEDNFEYLGMAILTKPFGVFEDEADTNATPPGMGFIGNSEYGKWKKDNQGNSFWSWYGKYALFSNLLFYSTMGPMRYNSWNRYNTGFRGRKPYFGTTASGAAQYGTSGTVTKQSSRFRNTSFAQMGGFKRPAPSVRGASGSVKGGGPKSKGK